MDLGPHAGFIIASYLIFTFVLAALVAWLVLDGRRLEKALADFEARGVKRRSARR